MCNPVLTQPVPTQLVAISATLIFLSLCNLTISRKEKEGKEGKAQYEPQNGFRKHLKKTPSLLSFLCACSGHPCNIYIWGVDKMGLSGLSFRCLWKWVHKDFLCTSVIILCLFVCKAYYVDHLMLNILAVCSPTVTGIRQFKGQGTRFRLLLERYRVLFFRDLERDDWIDLERGGGRGV